VYTYVIIVASYEGICVEFKSKRKQNTRFPTFKLPASTYNLLWLQIR